MKFSEMPYTRVDIKELEKAYQDLIERAKAAKSGEELFAIHQEYYKVTGEANSNYTIASIRHDIDTTDEFYEKENDYYDEILPTWQNYDVAYSRVLYESPFRDYMESKIGKVVFKNIEISLKAFDEKLKNLDATKAKKRQETLDRNATDVVKNGFIQDMYDFQDILDAADG